MRPYLASLLCAAALPAQAVIIKVNDPSSSNLATTIGDTKVSLDEAIRIVNLDNLARIAFVQTMSLAEQGQIAANPTSDDLILVDAAVVPTITLLTELTPIVTGIHQHQDVTIRGIGEPTVDAKGFSAAFPVRTNHAHIEGFRLLNGKTGIEADTELHYHPGSIGVFEDLHVEGQSEAGIRFNVVQIGRALPFRVRGCHIHSDPIGVALNAPAAQYPNVDLEIENCHLENDVIGVQIVAGITGGILSTQIFRTSCINSDTCIQVRRPVPSSDGQVFLRVLYGEWLATHHGIDVQGSAAGESVIHSHMAYVRGGPDVADFAYRSQPKTARFDLHASEMTFEGNLSILGSKDTSRIWHQNNRYVNGTFLIDNDGFTGIPDLEWNVFENCPLTVGAASRTPFKVWQCEFVRSPITGGSIVGGSVTLDQCYRGASPFTGAVTETNPAGGRWLGRATVTPGDPVIGTYVDLQLDYQPGILGAWILGASEARPKTTNYPYRYYFNVSAFVGLVGPYQLRDRVRLPIPFNASLIGAELFAQPVAVPLNPQTWQTPITLPAGGRFVIR